MKKYNEDIKYCNENDITSYETKLNNLVYDLYDINDMSQKIVETYLKKFS